jgi:hypothetical protein
MGRKIASALSLVAIVVVLALYGRHTLRSFGAFTIDDAAISYAYANNLADGRGFRLTPNTNPVEGFSNPLEVLVLVPCRWLGLDLDAAAKIVNVAAVVLAALFAAMVLWRNLQGYARLWIAIPCGFAFLWPTFNHWIAAGLEGGLLCGLQMAAVTLLSLSFRNRWRDHALVVVALSLVLVRPEGIVYAALAIAGRMAQSGRRWRCLGLVMLGCAGIFAIRFILFRQWLPSTYYAKMHPQAAPHSGWGYVQSFFNTYGLVYLSCGLPLFAFLTARTRIPALVAAAQGIFALLFAAIAGGDWMRHWRFIQPLQGPYWILCLLGLLAVLSLRTRHGRAWTSGLRANLILLSLGPLAYFGLHGSQHRIETVSAEHDVDMRRIAKVGSLYRGFGERLGLGRPLLIADVDVGGMSYPPGIDVLDMGGLADLTFGYSWTRRPSDIVDYFFDYRRPHTIHTHGGWVEGRPMHALSPFDREYRAMGQKLLDELAVSWLTAIRADLVDPPMAPVLPALSRVGSILIEGFSSLPDLDGQEALFIHALQVEAADLPPLSVTTADQRSFKVGWHAQQDVGRGPPGSALVGMVRLPAGSLPVAVASANLRLTDWPNLDYDAKSGEELSRLPMYRLVGLPAHPCKAGDFLASYANAGAQARGARLLADLCGGGLSRIARAALAAEISRGASALPPGEDRYDALRVHESLGLPTSTFELGRIERAKREHSPYDEVSSAWSERLLRSQQPNGTEIASGLRALVLARQYDKAVLTALARGFTTVPEAREPLCRAMSALGLQPYLVSQLRCGDVKESHYRLLRQGFEDPSDPTLHVTSPAPVAFLSETPIPRVGGQGRALLHLPACEKDACSEVTWGPLPWSGRRFGALVAGARAGSSVAIDAYLDGRWREVARAEAPRNEVILTPVLADLRAVSPAQVRVRVSNRSRNRAMTVDALTFLDLE